MNQHCILEHDGEFPQLPIKDFCTNSNCRIKLACTICKYQFHQGHVLKSLSEFQNFAAQSFVQTKQLRSTETINEINCLAKNIANYVQDCLQNYVEVTNYSHLAWYQVTNEILNEIISQQNPSHQQAEELLRIKNILQQCFAQLKPDSLQQQQQQMSNKIRIIPQCLQKLGSNINPGKREGFAIVEIKNPTHTQIYEGNWKQDLKHGYGKEETDYINGDTKLEKYEGQWMDDLKHGFGTLTIEKFDGEVRIYRGEFVTNLLKGFACVIEKKDNKQSVIFAIFKDGKQEGVSLKVEETRMLVDYYINGVEQNARQFYDYDKFSNKSLVFNSTNGY